MRLTVPEKEVERVGPRWCPPAFRAFQPLPFLEWPPAAHALRGGPESSPRPLLQSAGLRRVHAVDLSVVQLDSPGPVYGRLCESCAAEVDVTWQRAMGSVNGTVKE